jgi:hypothetical protein
VAAGNVLRTTNGTWVGAPTSYQYQWQDCAADGTGCSNISGATSSTYSVQASDAGHTIEALVTAANSAGSATAGAPIVPLVDNFGGSSVDSNVWKVLNQQGDTSNGEFECYEPGQVTESGDQLTETLGYQPTAFTCPGQVNGGGTPSGGSSCTGSCGSIQQGSAAAHWESGAVQEWNTNFTYGTIVVKAKLAGQTAQAWPAIWLLGAACQTSSASPFTFLSGTSGTSTGYYCPWSGDSSDAAEIDIAEGITGNDTSMSMTEWNGGAVRSCTSGTISDYSQNYHVYELDWSPGSLVWKIDGTTECSSTRSVPSHPMFLIINTAAASANSGAGGNTVVDYVHVSH